jgi:hypothetical protein
MPSRDHVDASFVQALLGKDLVASLVAAMFHLAITYYA